VPLLSGSTDWVVTIPETLASVCANVKVTIVLPSPMRWSKFESTPVPVHVPARLTGCEGAAADDPLGCDDAAVDPLGCDDAVGDALGGGAASGDPLPAPPHETASTARPVTMMIDRTDCMRNSSTVKYNSQVF
jgi:hypothetical protein